jgi:hypothetical protein
MRDQFSVRLEKKDKSKIEKIARENSRTLNGQIEFLIKQCIEKYEDIKGEIKIQNQEAI